MKKSAMRSELLFPGSNLLGEDVDRRVPIQDVHWVAAGQLETAAATLMMFEAKVGEQPTIDPSSPGYAERREEILRESASGWAAPDASEYLKARLEAEVQQARAMGFGHFPGALNHALVRSYAREFIYALDNVKNLLERLAREPGAPSEVSAPRRRFRRPSQACEVCAIRCTTLKTAGWDAIGRPIDPF